MAPQSNGIWNAKKCAHNSLPNVHPILCGFQLKKNIFGFGNLDGFISSVMAATAASLSFQFFICTKRKRKSNEAQKLILIVQLSRNSEFPSFCSWCAEDEEEKKKKNKKKMELKRKPKCLLFCHFHFENRTCFSRCSNDRIQMLIDTASARTRQEK